MLETIAKRWWLLLLRGMCAVLFGVLAFMWPGATLLVLVMLYAAYALIDGVTALVLGLTGRMAGAPWWGMVLVGLLGIAAGALTILWPGITAFVLLALIAASAIVRGVFEIIAAIRLRKVIDGEWLLGLAGVISIVFGIILLTWPAQGLLALVWLIAAYAVAFGLLAIALSFRLRGLLHT
jgi:uncharacterized membrane protein HdeD (DUF308 family)